MSFKSHRPGEAVDRRSRRKSLKSQSPVCATAKKKTAKKATKKKTARKVTKKKAVKKTPAKPAADIQSTPTPITVSGETKSGALRKMHSEVDATSQDGAIEYFMPLGDDDRVPLNSVIGQPLRIAWAGVIECVHCGRKTNKSFNQGYCFPCLRKLAQCDSCIIKPELCHYHEGTCREPEWGEKHCFQPHVVYIANTSGIKVGITRGTQIPTRWIDQGARSAIPVFIARDRRQSGLVEMAIKQHVADKTDFRRMLKGNPEERDMEAVANEMREAAADAIKEIRKEHGEDAVIDAEDSRVRHFDFPVQAFPEKVTSVTLDKRPEIIETLTGIKGQYLIFGNTVFNVRRHAGYCVEVTAP